MDQGSPSRPQGVSSIVSARPDLPPNGDPTRVREAFPQLSQAQLTAALMYFRRYPGEIQREIAANAALIPDAIEERYPGLVRFITTG